MRRHLLRLSQIAIDLAVLDARPSPSPSVLRFDGAPPRQT